jgi:hypothetical protein
MVVGAPEVDLWILEAAIMQERSYSVRRRQPDPLTTDCVPRTLFVIVDVSTDDHVLVVSSLRFRVRNHPLRHIARHTIQRA